MSLGRVVGPLWAGEALDLNINLPYMTGAVVMLIGFVASLAFLSNKPTVIESTAGAD